MDERDMSKLMADITNACYILIEKPDRKKQAGRPHVDGMEIRAWKLWKQCLRTRSKFNWL